MPFPRSRDAEYQRIDEHGLQPDPYIHRNRAQGMPNATFPSGVLARAADLIDPPTSPYLEQPRLWATEKLREHLWSKQVQIMDAVRDYPLVAVKSCHASGKSFTAARTVGWWLDPSVHPFGSAFAATTAPTWAQVQAILWKELARVHARGKLPGRTTLDCQMYMGGRGSEELVAMGRKPADYDENSFQGIHARYVLAVIDEAGGVTKSLFDQILTIVTNDESRVLAIGNPTDPSSHFAEICKPGSGWHVIEIPAWSTPNFTGEEVPEEVSAVLISPGWVDARRRDWGEGSPLWKGRIEAQFPDVTDDTLFSPAWISRCTMNELPGIERGQYAADIARLGVDRTVVYRNRGGSIRHEASWAKMDTEQSAQLLMRILDRNAAARIPIVIDSVGVGAGPYDRLRHARYNVKAFSGGEKALNFKRFRNRRAEIYYGFKELGDAGLLDLDPTDDKLLAELASIRWWVDSADRIVVEGKEDMRDRGLPSPDHADAAVMSTVQRGSAKEDAHALRHGDGSLTTGLRSRAL